MKYFIGGFIAPLALLVCACSQAPEASIVEAPQGMSQSDIAVGIVEKGLIGNDAQFIARHVAKDYIQHNPQAQDGRAGLLGFAEYLAASGAENSASIVRVLEQGDLVALHVIYDFGGEKMVAFDIFRFENDVAVEHWDALQPLTEETVSGRSMTGGATDVSMSVDADESAKIVTGFVNEVLIGGQADRLESYIAQDYLQHNPNVGDGLDGLVAFITDLEKQGISFSYSKTHKVIAEGDFVLTQNEGEFGGKATVFYDLFRVEGGKIAEHWDVIQEIPQEAANDNGMF